MVMQRRAPAPPTPEAIADGSVREGQDYEFKAEADLGDSRKKCDLVDDFVGFLNAGPGHLVIGVLEKKGAFDRFSPVQGDPDAKARQLAQIAQDNIDPRPLDIGVSAIDVEGGFLLCARIGDHRRQPYQNRINGAFVLRTGAKNTPLSREEVRARFVEEDRYADDARALMLREDERTATRAALMARAPTLHLAIIPREHYGRAIPRFERSHAPPNGLALKGAPIFHAHARPDVFRGCLGGSDNLSPDSDGGALLRFFVGDDWSIYAQVAWPIETAEAGGRLDLPRFDEALRGFLRSLDAFLKDEGLKGPFCVDMAMHGLHHPKTRSFFPASPDVEGRPILVDRIGDPGLAAELAATVRRATRYL